MSQTFNFSAYRSESIFAEEEQGLEKVRMDAAFSQIDRSFQVGMKKLRQMSEEYPR